MGLLGDCILRSRLVDAPSLAFVARHVWAVRSPPPTPHGAMRALISHSCRLAFRAWRLSGAPTVRFQRAQFSSACVEETVSVPVGNNGFVGLRITRPALPSQDRVAGSKTQGPNVILYLPPGPLFRGVGADHALSIEDVIENRGIENESLTKPSPPHVLASATAATVVTVEYRLGKIGEDSASYRGAISSSQRPSTGSPELTSTTEAETSFYKYPTPTHDTIAGFDWIQTHLQPAQLGIFGSHIGGSLALMLALTEPQSVTAVAAADPVCDWLGLDEYCISNAAILEGAGKGPKKKSSRTIAPPDLLPLLEARKQFFSSFERCFDAFASPILFLRSAGRDVPKAFPQYLTGPGYPVPVLQETRSMTSAEQHAAADGSLWDRDVYPTDEETYDENNPPPRRRKALSRWPPYGLDYGSSGNTWSGPDHGVRRLEVTLPWVRVYSGGNRSLMLDSEQSCQLDTKSRTSETASTVLARQSEEMVSVLRRACFFGREKGFGERRVTLSKVDDKLEKEAANWFGDVFDGSLELD